jgi:hypothetical protein
MPDSISASERGYWVKFTVCCCWLALAVTAKMSNFDGLNIPIRVIGALNLMAVAIEITSPIALIWLFILAKDGK